MYRVTKRTPNKVLSQEFWSDLLKAEIRRDVINSQCDEFSGALLEEIVINDLEEIIPKGMSIEINWPDKKSLSGITMQFSLSSDSYLECKIDVQCEVSNTDISFPFVIYDFVYVGEDGSEVSTDISLPVLSKLLALAKEYILKNDTFLQYDSEEVNEVHWRSVEENTPNHPNTI